MKYRCSVCGYIYDEDKEGVRFEDLPEDWRCPVCGEGKEGFELMEDEEPASARAPEVQEAPSVEEGDLRELSAAELSALCSNLARGCEKQQLSRESELFKQISDYFWSNRVVPDHDGVASLLELIGKDLEAYPAAKDVVSSAGDRGSLRVLTWSEKVTMIMDSILTRYRDDPSFLQHTSVYVCDICGFIYIGDNPPAVCPVCKVPGFMILRAGGVA